MRRAMWVVAASAGVVIGVSRVAYADVWISDGSNYQLDRYSDSGADLGVPLPYAYEGIYDLAASADGTKVFAVTNTLGFADYYEYDVTTGTATKPIALSGFDAALSAGSPLVVAPDNRIIVGASGFFSPRTFPAVDHVPALSVGSLLLYAPDEDGTDTLWTTFAAPVPGKTSGFADLQFGQDGTLYANRYDGSLERYDGTTGEWRGQIGTTEQFTVSQTGAVAILTAQRDVVQIDPTTGAVLSTLLAHDTLDAAIGGASIPILDLTYGPNGGLLVAARFDQATTPTTPTTDNVRVLLFDATHPNGETFATTYAYGPAGPIYLLYTSVPEPMTATLAFFGVTAFSRRRR